MRVRDGERQSIRRDSKGNVEGTDLTSTPSEWSGFKRNSPHRSHFAWRSKYLAAGEPQKAGSTRCVNAGEVRVAQAAQTRQIWPVSESSCLVGRWASGRDSSVREK